MVRTRGQDKGDSNDQAPKSQPNKAESRPKGGNKKSTEGRPKREHESENEEHTDPETSKLEKPSNTKKAKGVQSTKPSKAKETKSSTSPINKTKLDALFEAYGVLPLTDSTLEKPTESTPETILAFVYFAMLTSARISHVLAYESVKCLIEAGYDNIETLKNSTWQERTEVLTKGGYTRYREKTATALGELAQLVEEKYDGDLNNLLKQADSSPAKVRSLLQEIKGIGKVGIDIFCDAAQSIWPALAPFVDSRSMETAKNIGLGDNIESMWEAVGKDPVEMCKLSSALTMVRLDKVEKDF